MFAFLTYFATRCIKGFEFLRIIFHLYPTHLQRSPFHTFWKTKIYKLASPLIFQPYRKMVSFTTINQGVFLISIMMLGSSVVAAPAAVAGNKTTEAIIIPLHINATEITYFKFPPIISSRAEPVSHPDFIGDLHAEVKSIEKNTKYFKEHGGDFDTITKRDDINSVGGMLVDLPDTGLPPKPKVKAASSNAVVIASSTQVQDLKFYAAVASTAYCTTVVPSNKWTCKNCLKYVPDGKLLVSFTSAKGDINGFVLRSDEQKTIHLVFRGTSSFSNWIVVSCLLLLILMTLINCFF
jgi:hypothetical protein